MTTSHSEAVANAMRGKIDWQKRLNASIKKWFIHGDDWACDAGSWVTCAVGNLCAEIPRYKDSLKPKDKLLAELGEDFAIAVTYIYNVAVDHPKLFPSAIEDAKETLNLIEQRAILVLAQLEEEKK